MNTTNITLANLSNFWGSEQLYFNPLFRAMKYTEGVRFLSVNGAGWLVDLICATLLHAPKHAKKYEFVHVKLTVNLPSKIGVVKFDDGDDNVFYIHNLDYTDFPLPEISLYVENGVIMLPSER